MIEFRTKVKPKIALLLDKKIELTFTTENWYLKELETIKDKELEVIVREYKKPRSLDQNAYMWVLLEELAKRLSRTREEMYRFYIKDYGQSEIVPIRNDVLEDFKRRWCSNGMGWITEELGNSKLDGYTNLRVISGSSSYNTKEMSRVVDAIVRDCADLGISTMSVDEILKLKNKND